VEKISIDQLINEQQFLLLKKDFLTRDEKYRIYFKSMNEGNVPPEIDYKNNNISYLKEGFTDLSDELGISFYEGNGIFTEVKENFYVDYLNPLIKAMYITYTRKIEEEFTKKDILNPSDIKFFGEKITNILITKISNIESSRHLDFSSKALITNVFDEITNFVYLNYISDRSTKKINFNLNKNKVVVFFNLLLNNKIISDVHIMNFNEMIQKTFRYKSGKEYKDIDKAYKLYNELLGANPSKSATNTLSSLKKIFQNSNFFSP